MKAFGIMMAFSLSLFLLFAGCASQEPEQPAPQAPPVQNAPDPPSPPVVVPAPVANTSPNQTNATVATPLDVCTVKFQKDTSNIYYLMVETDSQKQLSVTCPNGKEGQKQGELYFCTQLEIDSPAIAYLDGEECGRALFSTPDKSVVPTGGQQCKVLLAPSRITVGETSAVTVTAYVPQEKSKLTYNCGDREITESVGGIVDTAKICKFDKPGTIEVYAKINNETCAIALLEVFSSPKDCSVFGAEFRMDRNEYVYTAKVAARGYSGNDYLRFKCAGVMNAIKANTIPDTADFVTTIECRYPSKLSEGIKVTMGGDACGEISMQQ